MSDTTNDQLERENAVLRQAVIVMYHGLGESRLKLMLDLGDRLIALAKRLDKGEYVGDHQL